MQRGAVWICFVACVADKMKSKIITLSAVSAALTALALTVGAYFEFLDLYCVVISSIFIIMPLYLNSYKGCFLCSLVGGIIAFLFSGFNILSLVFPAYFAFFGFYPIIKNLEVEKNFNKKLGFILGLIWFIAVAYGVYFYYTAIMNGIFDGLPEWIEEYILYLIAPIALVFFVIYDKFVIVIRRFIDRYLGRFIR